MIELYNNDCIGQMQNIADKSIDLILCDLPYNTTANKWDNLIPFEKLWENYERIIKDNGIICLFSRQPFTSKLIMSNLPLYRYNWIWKKESASAFLNSHYAPLKITEDICVFSKATVGSASKNKIKYNPPCLTAVNKQKRNNPKSNWREKFGYTVGGNKLNSDTSFIQKYTGYPNNILEFPHDKEKLHPTQKPIALLEFLIKTYTEENSIVLSNTMGSGSTGVACKNTNRNFIGIELDKKYFEIAKERIEKA